MSKNTMINSNTQPQLSESDLLTKVFQQERSLVVLVTYSEKRYVRVRKVTQYNLLIQDALPIPKLEVVMAYATEDHPRIESELFIDKAVKALDQQPIKKIRDRKIVNMVVAPNDPVHILLRTGDVITGFCSTFSPYNILLNVNGAPVLVYKHGIHELTNYKM